MSRPLSWRAEWGRQARRRRTLWLVGIVLVLPLVLVAAFALDPGGPPNRTGSIRPVDVATASSANFALFTLLVSAEFLLLVVGALFVGDPVPAEASWSSLRYLLTAPVARARLLTSKLVVGYAWTALVVVLLPVWCLVVGLVFYGAGPFEVPAGGELGWGEFIPRLIVATAYILLNVAPIGAFAFWIGVRSDTPLAAVGGAVVLLIVSGILDSIDALGDWRKVLPGHYSRSWLQLFAPGEVDWTDLRHGALWAVLFTIVFLALGYRRFRRQDVLS